MELVVGSSPLSTTKMQSGGRIGKMLYRVRLEANENKSFLHVRIVS